MKLAFIGAGNMAQAMIGGVLRKGLLPKNEIIATAATQKTVAAQYGVNVTLDNKEAAKADIIVLAVKPVYYAEVIAEIKDVVFSEQIIVTIAAGKSVAWVEEAFGGSHKIVRTMPNTPALVGEGITAGKCWRRGFKAGMRYFGELWKGRSDQRKDYGCCYCG